MGSGLSKHEVLAWISHAEQVAEELIGKPKSAHISEDYAILSKNVAMNQALRGTSFPPTPDGDRVIPIPAYLEERYGFNNPNLTKQRRYGRAFILAIGAKRLTMTKLRLLLDRPSILKARKNSRLRRVLERDSFRRYTKR